MLQKNFQTTLLFTSESALKFTSFSTRKKMTFQKENHKKLGKIFIEYYS